MIKKEVDQSKCTPMDEVSRESCTSLGSLLPLHQLCQSSARPFLSSPSYSQEVLGTRGGVIVQNLLSKNSRESGGMGYGQEFSTPFITYVRQTPNFIIRFLNHISCNNPGISQRRKATCVGKVIHGRENDIFVNNQFICFTFAVLTIFPQIIQEDD